MKFILLIAICGNFLFSTIINDKYIISKNSLSSLINSSSIYEYINKNKKLFGKLEKKSFFSLGRFNTIKTKKESSYKNLYIFDTKNDDYVYIKVPIRLLKSELDLKEYKKNNEHYILRFKKEFTKKNLVYLNLDIGEKKEFVFTYKSKDIYKFLKKHSNLLFEKEDIIDKISISDKKITFTTNYTQKDFKLNFYLKDFINIHRKKIISKKVEKSFLLKIDNNLPPLECNNKNLLDSIYIDDEEFIIGDEKITSEIYSLYLLSNKNGLNEYLKNNIKFVRISSIMQDENIHNLSYEYRTKKIKIFLKIPKNIDYDIKSKFISSFNSFKFQIDGGVFDGYIDGKSTYYIPQNICQTKKNKINVLNIKNYSEYAQWDMNINDDKNYITWTPKFNIYKMSHIIYAPFLLKRKNKYVISSMMDEKSKMKGEVRYSYLHKNKIYQNKTTINPKTNTNLYFKYPKRANINSILEKTKFMYNSNPISIVDVKDNEIKFTSTLANKIALIYVPSGNIDSFRKYFLRYFECSQKIMQDDESCFNYLADMENGINDFLNKIRKSKKYSQIVYRKSIHKEQDKKNLFILNRENRNYNQAKDNEVFGKNYDNYKWKLSLSLSNDKKVFNNYGLNNIDLIYFSNIGNRDTKTLSTLNDYGFHKVFLINFGQNIKDTLSEYKNIQLVHHKYNKNMDAQIQEFDVGIFKNILKQIAQNK